MTDNISRVAKTAEISDEAEIIDSVIGQNVFIDKHTRVEHSSLADRIKLERNNQIVYSSMGRFSYTGANTVIKNAAIGKFNSIS